MLPNIVKFLSQHPLTATDSTSMEQWVRDCSISWTQLSDTYLSSEESSYGASLLSTCLMAYKDLAGLVSFQAHSSGKSWPKSERICHLELLLNRPQVEQRTDAWYTEAAHLITASQFATLFKGERTRALLVVEKASKNVDTSNRRTVVLTEQLNPFTWGIRFEPCVKQIYQSLTHTRVADLGRLKHRSDPHLAASPDGLVVEGPDERLARFVEFKAPISRPILKLIPDDYLVQMQIQMEVGNVEECDYLEVKFNSAYQGSSCPCFPRAGDDSGVSPYSGNIFLINSHDGILLRYEYSPLNNSVWRPNLVNDEVISDIVPWWTNDWYLTTVGRSRSWFASTLPAMVRFWSDVELAKQGKFIVPAPRQKAYKQVCKFVDESAEITEVPPIQSAFVEDV